MTGAFEPARYDFEYLDTAGYPDGVGTLSQDQKILVDEVLDDRAEPSLDFGLVDDEKNGAFIAFSGDTEIGGITYSTDGNRIVLLAASVYPEFRHQGVATEMIRRVLDQLREMKRTVTIVCPIVRTFIDDHPEYEALVDPTVPGVKHVGRR